VGNKTVYVTATGGARSVGADDEHNNRRNYADKK